ncbi:hypothetical protein [Knoellia subterranea]|uniref:Cell division protein DivIVA n=1 Tax=Knoellia subterranea KCTC 19937 TaxID=1385521 RepID=A0A0A0JR09_9MICO|nr:hypothetical protein [Knoellia subterranea]KGN39628.1 hypothetical protein N803_02970 [Knoellia subterranea KCTC 19937]
MQWVALGLLAVTVITVTVLVATDRLDLAGMAEATSSKPPLELPEQLTAGDVDQLALGTAAYGYEPAAVDVALQERRDRLAEQEEALTRRVDVEVPDDVHGHG